MRVRLSVVVLLALLASLAVALAAGAQEEKQSAPKPVDSRPLADASQNPLTTEKGREQFAEAVRKAEAQDRQKAEKLASPESATKRERSRTEFIGLTDNLAIDLLADTFGQKLVGTAAPDLNDVAAGRRIEKYINDRTVVLAGTADQPPVLVELPNVARVADEAGDKKEPVDLTLEPRTDGSRRLMPRRICCCPIRSRRASRSAL